MASRQTYKIVVLLNAADGKDDTLNDWFSNIHMPDVLEIPGIKTGQRFRLTDAQREGASRMWTYLALYDVETDNLQGVIDELKQRAGTPLMVGTDSIAPGGFVHFFQPITPVVLPG